MSFTKRYAADAAPASERESTPGYCDKVVALFGGSGRVGKKLRAALQGKIRSVRILDLVAPDEACANETWSPVDICDFGSTLKALKGIDAIVHLAGFPGERPIEDIVRVNVMGTHNIYEAARQLGISRVVLGSSNHVTGFFTRDQRVSPDGPMRPDSLYGLGKCWNELEAGLYFQKHGIESFIIRIANATMEPADSRSDERSRATWLSGRDLAQLVMIGLESPHVDCTTVYGVSQSPFSWWDNSVAFKLGYDPLDRGVDHTPPLATTPPGVENRHIADHFQGGRFCAIDHDGVVRTRR
ncbi:uronate dehydrogenase [Neorhizobium sp. R1-B]|uniref:NAD-dependent epimerase/dehydratase family protein n=1 Tax=Neorhizobium sp. R1-B TaxID=2485162 RepID=UPI001064C8B8|nr:NAD(P)-dependent oxidoreductase [Neorhizobium sp. R1-B]TDX70397.1 uronate dehydrogenase [Neorhizobium sp. R1-B]